MELKLKNVKFSEKLSEETSAFSADLFIGTKKVAYVSNHGKGGDTNYNAYDGCKDLLKTAEEYAKSLPDREYNLGAKKISMHSNLENIIDDMFNEWLDAKEQKRILSNEKKGIIYSDKTGLVTLMSWKGQTIDSLLKIPKSKEMIKNKVKSLEKQGFIVLNTNLQL